MVVNDGAAGEPLVLSFNDLGLEILTADLLFLQKKLPHKVSAIRFPTGFQWVYDCYIINRPHDIYIYKIIFANFISLN